MKKISSRLFLFFSTLLALFHFISACKSPSDKLKENTLKDDKSSIVQQQQFDKIQKVTYFIENSESVFGYVSSISDYVDVVAELAEKPEFVKENTLQEFFFINGLKPTITFIGEKASDLQSKLNPAGFNCGDKANSNLNAMFQVALENAKNDSISVLISDGIYDIGEKGKDELVTEGKETRSKFIKRLQHGDVQTLMIKLNSQFKGKYFYASQSGQVSIDSRRPYYIWIFGNSRLLNKYFSVQYVSQYLKGYETMARFMKPDAIICQYQATSENSIGTFKFDYGVDNSLLNAKSDEYGKVFQFSIAVDYSSLPYAESYLTSPDNYSVNNYYKIVSIKRPDKKIHSVSFTPTHLITLQTNKNPRGQLVVSLRNTIPTWIETSDIDSDANIITDTLHTYGLKYLTDGIIQAYQSVYSEQNIVNFKIEIR